MVSFICGCSMTMANMTIMGALWTNVFSMHQCFSYLAFHDAKTKPLPLAIVGRPILVKFGRFFPFWLVNGHTKYKVNVFIASIDLVCTSFFIILFLNDCHQPFWFSEVDRVLPLWIINGCIIYEFYWTSCHSYRLQKSWHALAETAAWP